MHRSLGMIHHSILLVVVATIPLYFAAAHKWVWPFFASAVALAMIAFIWDNKRPKLKLSRGWFLWIAFFFIWSLFQCVPLPLKLLAFLSPNRHALIMQSTPLTEIPIQWGAISYNYNESMAWWILMVVLWGMYAVLRSNLTVRRQLIVLITVLFVLAGIQSLYGILQILIPQLGVLGVTRPASYSSGTYFNRNHFAGFIEMMFPVCLGYILSYLYGQFGSVRTGSGSIKSKMMASGGKQPVFLWIILLIMMFVAIIFSQSRAGILGILFGLFVFSVLIRTTNKKLAHRLWFGLAVLLWITLLYGFRIGFDGLIDRFMNIGEGDSRIAIWMDSLVILKDHPLGIGLMNFKSVFGVYEESTSFIGTVRYTHNDVLQLLIETGWPGFISLFGGFVVLIYKQIIRVSNMRPQNDPLYYFLATGSLCGLISIGFHSFFDFNLQIPANMVYFIVLLAILNVCTEKSSISRYQG